MSHYPEVLTATEKLRTGLAIAAIDAHEALLVEFQVGGAADNRNVVWFKYEKESLVRALESISITSVLIATVGFTGFLSPPGDWGTGDAQFPLKEKPGNSSPLLAFAFANTIALSTSTSLVVIISVCNAFGLTLPGMTTVLQIGFVLLLIAVVASLAAFAAAGFVLFPAANGQDHFAKLCATIISASVLLLIILLIAIAVIAQRKSSHEEYKQQVATLEQVGRRALLALRAINNSHANFNDDPIGDAAVSLYLHQYVVVVCASIIPLFYYFMERIRDIYGEEFTSVVATDRLKGLHKFVNGIGERKDESLYHWAQIWCTTCRKLEGYVPAETWDAGIKSVRWGNPTAHIPHEHVREGKVKGRESDGDVDVSTKMVRINDAARELIANLCRRNERNLFVRLGSSKEETNETKINAVSKYRYVVKDLFCSARLEIMMSPSIREAVLDEADQPGAHVDGVVDANTGANVATLAHF